MIVTILLILLDRILLGLGLIFPRVTLENIWVIGPTLRSVLVTAVGYMNSIFETLPHLEVVWNMFVYVVVPFEIVLWVMKFILGSRTPVNNLN